MSDLEKLPERVDVIERKLDALAVSVDRRFEAVDRRFDDVTEALVEQRQYTEFAFTQLDAKMTSGFAKVETRLERVERKLERLDHIEQKLERLDHVELKLDRLDHVEQKLDQLVVAGTRRRRSRRK